MLRKASTQNQDLIIFALTRVKGRAQQVQQLVSKMIAVGIDFDKISQRFALPQSGHAVPDPVELALILL